MQARQRDAEETNAASRQHQIVEERSCGSRRQTARRSTLRRSRSGAQDVGISPRKPPAPRKNDASREAIAGRAPRPVDLRQSGLFDAPTPGWMRPCLPTLVDETSHQTKVSVRFFALEVQSCPSPSGHEPPVGFAPKYVIPDCRHISEKRTLPSIW